MSATGSAFTVSLFLALGFAMAQGYPPGGYPGPAPYPGTTPLPGQTPYPGRGSTIPAPTRGGKQSPQKQAELTPSFRGTLKLLDEKTISLEMGDHRVLDFKRTSKTRFLRKGEEVKPALFHEGDEITVEGFQETGGYLTAVNVHLEDGSKPAAKDGVVDTWAKDTPGSPQPKTEAGGSPADTARTQPSAPRDPDDPGPPRLTRGGPADPKRQVSATSPSEAAEPVFRTVEEGVPSRIVGARPTDELIRRAADAALDFTEGLPAYICQEVIARYESETRKPDWKALDVVTANLVYENGREEYRDVAINGKKTGKSMQESGGAWSTGEFGTVLIDLFSPATAAEFRFRRESRIAGTAVRVYEFDVPQERSHWQVHAGSQKYMPAYKGSAWIDPQTARVMRIEMQAYGFPAEFPIDHSETTTDYQQVRLGDAKQYLLPVHAENLSCQRGTTFCSRNVIDFRNYRKYAGEATVVYEEPKK